MRDPRIFLSTVIAAAVMACSVHATSDVSSLFDGRYRATLTPVAAMSAPNCSAITVAPFQIEKGFIRAGAAIPAPAFTGFVTGEGFLTGQFKRPDQPSLQFEGRFVDGVFSGGVISEAERCAWLVTFDTN